VVLDFVARDSHSHPVRDLRPDEIKITDGGATVKIERLQLVGGGSGGQQAPGRPASYPSFSTGWIATPPRRRARRPPGC
jgi:hypothetical protein